MSIDFDAIYDCDYYNKKGSIETPFWESRILRPEQACAFYYAFAKGRHPKAVLSIGCGAGVLEAFMDRFVYTIGTDPSKAAEILYKGKHFVRCGLGGAFEQFFNRVDTIMFVSSLEHIARNNVSRFLPRVKGAGKRMIITNRLEYYPIRVNNWDHITKIDDRLYTWIESLGTVLFRHGSHLVIDT